MLDWSKYKNFSKTEFDCTYTGKNRMRVEFIEILQQIRTVWGKPMIINSGFRDVSHPDEVRKISPGAHTYGVASDIAVGNDDFIELMVICFNHGIRRMGILQKGNVHFLHIDIGDKDLGFHATGWTY